MSLNIQYDIYDPPGVIVAQMHGIITIKELFEHVDELAQDKMFRDGLDKLVDMTQIDSMELHLEDEEQLVDYKMIKGVRERRIAFIAAEDTNFGMSRVYQVLSEQIHKDVSVHRTADDALAWLGLPSAFKKQLNKGVVLS